MLHKHLLPLLLSFLLLFSVPAFADDVAQAPEEPAATESTEVTIEAPATEAPASDPVPTFEYEDSNCNAQDDTPTTAPTEVTQEPQIDYTGLLTTIYQEIQGFAYTTQLIAGFLLFFVVVVLCFFSYKFFRIFF